MERATKEVVESLGPMSHNAAIRVERGVNINLNHGGYITEIVEAKDESNGEQDTVNPSE
jgi:hypothetical protein